MTLAELMALGAKSAKFQVTTSELSETTHAAAMSTPKTTLKAIVAGDWSGRPLATKLKRPGGYKVDDAEKVSTLETVDTHDFIPGRLKEMEDVTVECLLPAGSAPVSGNGFRGCRVVRLRDTGKYDADYFVGTVTVASVSDIDVEGKRVTRVTYTVKPLSIVETDAALTADPTVAVEEGGA